MKKKVIQIQEQARAATLAKQFDKGLALYEQILRIQPNDEESLLNKGLIYELTGKLDLFIEHSKATYAKFPNHPKFIIRMAAAEFKEHKFSDAFERLKSIEISGFTFDGLMIACASAAALGREGESALYALEAIKLRPADPLAHSNLGGALLSLGKKKEALICFETALLLDPSNPQANANVAVIHGMERRPLEAIKFSEKALEIYKKLNKEEEVNKNKFYLSLLYLQTGNLQKGWAYFDYGFKVKDASGRAPKRSLPAPKWSGENLKGKTIMLWREQGVGDELMFYSAINYINNIGAKIIIECDVRLQSLLRRSFPKCIVRPYLSDDCIDPKFVDYDYHSSIGSAYGNIFSTLDVFNGIQPYLIPSPDRVEFYNQRLGKRDSMLRVGIGWRSGVRSPTRDLQHTELSDWGEIFNLPNVQFVNLQYGDVQEEVAAAENEFQISLNNWIDINRKDDFDDMAALMVNLDIVVTTGSAIFQLAGALGVKTLLMATQLAPYQLGLRNRYPHHPLTEIFYADTDASISSLFKDVIPNRIKELQLTHAR